MTNKERFLTAMTGGIPDCVPVAPDFSNMIPAKMTGKPFWDLYLYNDPPIWEAYIDCARYFNIDALMDGYFPLTRRAGGERRPAGRSGNPTPRAPSGARSFSTTRTLLEVRGGSGWITRGRPAG